MADYNDSRHTYNSALIVYNGLAPARLDGTQPADSGTISRRRHVTRALAGAQDAPSGAFTGQKGTWVTLTGSQDQPTGVLLLLKRYDAFLTGAQDAPSGALDPKLRAKRTLTGDQPASAGAVIRARRHRRVLLTGSQPQPSISYYNDDRYTYNQDGTAYNGIDPGQLTWVVHYKRIVQGFVQPPSTGTLIYLRTEWPWVRYYPTVYDRPEELHYAVTVDTDDHTVRYHDQTGGKPDGVLYQVPGAKQYRN